MLNKNYDFPGLYYYYCHDIQINEINERNENFEKRNLFISNDNYDELVKRIQRRIKIIEENNNQIKKNLINYLNYFNKKRLLCLKSKWKLYNKIPLNKINFIKKYGKKFNENINDLNEIKKILNYNNKLYLAYLSTDLNYIKNENINLYNDLIKIFDL